MSANRQKKILKELREKGSVNVLDLAMITGASESSIRRDLVEMDAQGLLKRVHGGATLLPKVNATKEDPLSQRLFEHSEEKRMIAEYAANLVEAGDVVYIDAGSTTLLLIDYLSEKNATYITNGLIQAQQLSLKGFKVICIGGEIRGITGACVGAKAVMTLSRYHFTKGFFGTNGIHIEEGFTTPDDEEAMMKEEAMKRTHRAYVLSDSTKFHKVCPVCFGDIDDAVIITDKCEEEYKEYVTIVGGEL